MFSDKPWKKWKTRKATLVFSIFCICLYTSFCIVMSFYDKMPDSTLTAEIFDFFKWLILTGCSITILDKIKSKQPEEETLYEEEV